MYSQASLLHQTTDKPIVVMTYLTALNAGNAA